MSRETSEKLVHAYFDAFNRGDRDGMIHLLDPQIRHDVNEGDSRIGTEKFRAFMQHMDRCYRERLSGIVVMSNSDGSRTAASFTVHGEYIATDAGLPEARGQTYELPAGSFFEVRDGRIAAITTYYNLRKWIALVGG